MRYFVDKVRRYKEVQGHLRTQKGGLDQRGKFPEAFDRGRRRADQLPAASPCDDPEQLKIPLTKNGSRGQDGVEPYDAF